MIPKIIHYCWFGQNPLPNSALKCISSWKKFFPGFKIRLWNEESFDVNIIPYTAEAYSNNKFAFVSDYARFWILYRYGGIYFDTDVEVLKSFDPILSNGAFMGREAGTAGMVAPGLGLGTEAGNPIYAELLASYSKLHFLNEDGSFNQKTIVSYTTEVLHNKGLHSEDILEKIGDISFYPSEFFCPMDSTTGIIRITPNTYSIHHYDCSWINHSTLRWKLHLLKNSFNRFLFKFHLR